MEGIRCSGQALQRGDNSYYGSGSCRTRCGVHGQRVSYAIGKTDGGPARIVIRELATGNKKTIEVRAETGKTGGGDNRLNRDWLSALAVNSGVGIKTDAHQSLHTHRIVFTAEASRKFKDITYQRWPHYRTM